MVRGRSVSTVLEGKPHPRNNTSQPLGAGLRETRYVAVPSFPKIRACVKAENTLFRQRVDLRRFWPLRAGCAATRRETFYVTQTPDNHDAPAKPCLARLERFAPPRPAPGILRPDANAAHPALGEFRGRSFARPRS